MPWQECSKVDERLKLVTRLLEGEKMAVLCRDGSLRSPVRPVIKSLIDTSKPALKG